MIPIRLLSILAAVSSATIASVGAERIRGLNTGSHDDGAPPKKDISSKRSSSKGEHLVECVQPPSEDTIRAKLEATGGVCLVSLQFQGEGNYTMDSCSEMDPADRFPECYPIGVAPWHPENNVIIQFPDPNACDVAVSETWTVNGWDFTFVQIAPNEVFITPDVPESESVAVKLISGTLLDINVNGVLRDDGHWETYTVTPPNRAVSLFVDGDITEYKAGADGAVLVYFKIPKMRLNTPITSMSQEVITNFSGPFSDHFEWVPFGEYYPDPFAGVEFYNFAGLLLHDSQGSRLNHMQFWTLREDMDADNYHDHSDLDTSRAFAELHMALYQATGSSGMQTTLPGTENLRFEPNPTNIAPEDVHKYNQNNQTGIQIAIPLSPGSIHGPLWSVNNETGEPTLICSGGVQYPYHRWLAGRGQGSKGYSNPLRYSSWVAFEHPPEYATIPTTMLAYWHNAYLQSTMDPADCEALG